MNENYGVIIHPDNFDDIMRMTDEECGKVVHNMIKAFTGQDIEVFGDRFLDFVSATYCGRVKRDKELSEKQSENGKKGGAPFGNQNARKTSEKQAKNNPKSTQNQPKTNPNTNTNTNTNIYIRPSGTKNKFNEGVLTRDIDFEELEDKLVKN